MRKNASPLEALLWSIALPGFGQFLNGKYVKAVVLIGLEFLINLGARLNLAIMSSFQGDIHAAIAHTNYQWLMFYPCVYMFSIWDAYKDAGGGTSGYATLPFVGCAFAGTVGLMYSPTLRIFGALLGPVWLPMLFAGAGLLIGVGLGSVLRRRAAGDGTA
ncbi:hypothetical protein [Paenibacillus sp.]|uniref:hypothetical protein n=1 Tax=Paenibacillus sp. TaxID=58172 RepID=UPI002D718B39|nr:hypothetical protein [Paenibacillus sp.]HZG56444.1 hypothetical protein [Paenibacillus sp.]